MALAAGSIAFTGYNGDGNDNIAFVVLEEITAGTDIHFADQTWDGTSFAATETFWTWTATSTVAAGTIVRIDNFFSGTLTADVGSVAFTDATGRGLSASFETIYAYIGTPSVPTTFLAAIATKNFNSTADGGVLTNTGLIEGQTALSLNDNGGVDIGAFTGGRGDQVTFADYLPIINNPANWTTQDAAGDQSNDTTAPDVPFSTTAFTVCFAAGTRILTMRGEIAVQDLLPLDQAITPDGSARPIRWIGHRRIDLASHPRPELVAPIRIRRDAVAPNQPHRDLIVSPDHALFIDGVLVPARRLVNHATITREPADHAVTYFHVELDTHAILLSEGLPTESYLDTGNRGFFANTAEPVMLHPVMTAPSAQAARTAGSCAPFAEDAEQVRAIWQRLAGRHGSPVVPATENADPMLWADGRLITPTDGTDPTWVFVIPPGIRSLRLLSRAARPTDLKPWLDDQRRLGVRLSRITVSIDGECLDVPLDHPGLRDGWWDVEHDGPAMRRWTNGDAALPLPTFQATAVLRLECAGRLSYPVPAAEARIRLAG